METANLWDKATDSKYVKLPDNERHRYVLANPRLEEVSKFGEAMVELTMDVLFVDNEPMQDKVLTVTSRQLIRQLREFVENLPENEQIALSIKRSKKGNVYSYDVEACE